MNRIEDFNPKRPKVSLRRFTEPRKHRRRMTDTEKQDEELTVLQCWNCGGHGCWKCGNTGSVFWVNGRAYPYTPESEKRLRKANG